ncbi:MAG: hypothetical protein AAF943_05535 [Pseudomonadota bacterium]
MKSFLAAAAIVAGFATSAQAATLVAFDGVNGSSVAASEEAAGVTGFNLGRSIGLIQNSGNTFNSRGWDEGTDKASALANNNAIFWGLTIDANAPYDLTALEIDYDRSGTGPTSLAIDLFINGQNQGEIFSDPTVLDSGSQTALVDLTAFKNVTGSVFFRLLAWGATSSLGTFDIENDLGNNRGIIVTGEVSPIPLPAGLPLMLLGLGGVAALRMRKSRSPS